MFESATSTIVGALRAVDEAQARALELLIALDHDDVVAERAMPAEMALSLATGQPRHTVRQLLGIAETIATMPATRAALAARTITFAQAREIAFHVKDLGLAGRDQIDALVGDVVSRLVDAEPDALLNQVEHAVIGLAPEAQARREERRMESTYLAIQPYLDGSGGTLLGVLDTVGLASVSSAVDARADRPTDSHTLDAPSRGRQRMEALVRICEESLNDTEAGARARTRMVMCVDVRDVTRPAADGARVMWGALGKPGRLSPIATEVESCDADAITVLFDGGRPIGVSDLRAPVPAKIRAAVIARDGGCRFPSCGAPASWCDVHHINARGGHHPSNLVLLCRRCHNRMHRRVWRIEQRDDGTIAFTHRGRTYASAPRARPLRT